MPVDCGSITASSAEAATGRVDRGAAGAHAVNRHQRRRRMRGRPIALWAWTVERPAKLEIPHGKCSLESLFCCVIPAEAEYMTHSSRAGNGWYAREIDPMSSCESRDP